MSEQLRKGYKQTEIGLIPNDWEVKNLGDTANIVSGGTPSTNVGSYWNGNINWFTPTEIGLDKYVYESKRKISVEGLESSSARILPVNTIILTTRAGIGDLSILKIEACTNQGFQSFISNSNTNNEYLYYLLSTLKKEFLKNASGSTFLEISPNKLKSILVATPTLKEQTAIATALSDTDAWINSLEQLLTKKRQIKQGAMQELLKPNPEASEGWEVKKLGEIGKPYGGLSGKAKDDFYKGGYPYIPFMNIMSNPIIDKNYVDYVNIKQGEIQNKAQKFDLFFNGSSETPEEVGMCSVLLEDVPHLYLNSFCFGYRLFKEQNIDALYLSYFFRSDEGRNLFYSMAQGATRYNLSKGNFLKLEIKLPTPEEQTRIATILSDMDEEIGQLESKLEKAKQLKQGMMQELLTGRIRLV